MSAGTGGYLVGATTLSARPLFLARDHHHSGNSQGIYYTAAIIPLRW